MTDADIIAKANQALAQEFEIDITRMRPEAHFKEDLNLDSLDIVDMVVVLEQTFQIKIGKDPELMHIRTIGDMHAYILTKKEQLHL